MQTLSIINPLSPSADAELQRGGAAGPTAGAGPRRASQITPVSPLSRLQTCVQQDDKLQATIRILWGAASSNDESFCATPGEERSVHVSLVTPCHVSLVTTCHVSRVPNMFDLSSVCQITPRAPVTVLLLMSERACRCIYLCFTLYVTSSVESMYIKYNILVGVFKT